MTKSELIERLASQQSHIPAKAVEDAVKEMLEHMASTLAQGERIEIRGFGSFSLHYRAPRTGRNPKTGDKVELEAPENGYEHQKAMPAAPSPDGLPSETDIARKLAHLLPPQVKDKFLCDKPLEIRPVEFHNPMKGHIAEPVRQVWLRANGAVPDDLRIHQYLLGYASDFNFLPVALQPHGVGFLEPGMQVATIDHSMWFHRPFNINEWLLYSVESTSASSARGFVRGEFYTQDGTLVASTVQEGVMRNRNA